MNFKLRFAILFTSFVTVILLLSFCAIYILYYNYRQADFYNRVKSEGLEFYELVDQIKDPKEVDATKIIKGLHDNTLWDECLAVLDSNGRIINILPDTIQVDTTKPFLLNVKKKKELYYTINTKQYAALYLEDSKRYIIASGIDIGGLNRLYNLRYILGFVLLGGFLITALLSFFLIKKVLNPLDKLGQQIKGISESNLSTERINEGHVKDEIYQIAKQFNLMLERLKQSFEAQKSFVHHASHELRTPLATMLSLTESSLNKDLNKEEYKSILETLKEYLSDLIELSNSLLLLSQYEKMSVENKWQICRMDELLYDTIGYYKKMHPYAKILVSFSKFPDSEDDIKINADEALIKAAINNLIKNAIQYSVDKKVDIIIDPHPNVIKLHFNNIGSLLLEQEIDNLKTPFFRGKNAMNVRGFGLGLSIVERIMSVHKGNLVYTPIHPDVNRFTISLIK